MSEIQTATCVLDYRLSLSCTVVGYTYWNKTTFIKMVVSREMVEKYFNERDNRNSH